MSTSNLSEHSSVSSDARAGLAGRSSEDETLSDSDVVPPRAIKSATAFATAAAQTKLQIALEEVGYGPEAAASIARAVENPSLMIEQLRAPVTLGVHGGTLTYVVTRVRNGAVLPLPTNPRVSGRIRYPAGGAGSGGIEPLEVSGDPSGAAALITRAQSPNALRIDMRAVLDEVTATNDLSASIRDQGVLLPVTVVPVTFEFGDGSAPRHAACTVDGSSRTSAALKTWRLTPEAVLFELSNSVALQARTKATTELLRKDVQDLSDDDKAALRNMTIPASIIIGWSAEDESLSFSDLIDAYLGLIHVEPPTPWSEAASQDSRADAVLDELERTGRIGSNEKRYLAGLMSPQEAEESGFDPSLDGRAAAIFYALDRRWNANAVNRGLRRIGMKHVDRSDRLEVATELAMRPYRANVVEMARRNPRQALPQALQRLKPDNDSWKPSLDAPEVLLARALEEGASGGPASRELAVRAAFWLTRYSSLQKSSRTDARFADELLRDIAAKPRGKQQFYQAVVDGRGATIPRQVREDGNVATSATGEELSVEDRWLRKTFEPQEAPIEEDADEDFEPNDELRSRYYAIRDDAGTLTTKIEALREVEQDGKPLVEAVGIPQDTVEDISRSLSESRDRIQRLGVIWQMNGGSPIG